MAYTYNDFVTAANTAGLYDQFDEDDLQRAQKTPEYGLSLLGLKQDYNKATTDEQRLLVNENINQLRNNYGTPAAAAPAATPNGTNINFSYNAAEDPSYQALRKQYLREGDRATENALGSAAAASAGRPSSYAVTAATQAGDYYAGQLADRVPTLEQNAYSRALNEFNAGKQKYESIKETITNSGYMPTDEELAQAGMTKEETAQWRKVWGWQAYQNGQISGEQYKELFGEYPNGYVQPGGGWYGGGGGSKTNSLLDMFKQNVDSGQFKAYEMFRDAKDTFGLGTPEYMEAINYADKLVDHKVTTPTPAAVPAAATNNTTIKLSNTQGSVKPGTKSTYTHK